jgi:hypothetical protein
MVYREYETEKNLRFIRLLPPISGTSLFPAHHMVLFLDDQSF